MRNISLYTVYTMLTIILNKYRQCVETIDSTSMLYDALCVFVCVSITCGRSELAFKVNQNGFVCVPTINGIASYAQRIQKDAMKRVCEWPSLQHLEIYLHNERHHIFILCER